MPFRALCMWIVYRNSHTTLASGTNIHNAVGLFSRATAYTNVTRSLMTRMTPLIVNATNQSLAEIPGKANHRVVRLVRHLFPCQWNQKERQQEINEKVDDDIDKGHSQDCDLGLGYGLVTATNDERRETLGRGLLLLL
jgi:hypothetical protein